MKELFSKAEDCFELAKYLSKELGWKMDFRGSVYNEVLSGTYTSLPFDAYNTFLEYTKNKIIFDFKFCKDGFLRLSVGHNINPQSVGHKLAALSDFYEILYKQFGKPTVFYTTKNDPEGALSLQWSFINKDEEVKNFKNGTYFDDAEIDKLILIDEPSPKKGDDRLNENTKELISKQIGLPFELLPLVEENIEDFIKYKTEQELSSSKEEIEEKSETSSAKKIRKQ